MEFLKIDYTTLEIYLKEKNPSNDEDINDTSQFISIANIILIENPDIMSEDLNMFIESAVKVLDVLETEIKK